MYQGSGACVCVCVEGKGEGDVGRRMCTSLCKLHFPQGYMKGFDDGGRVGENFEPLFLKLTSPPGCMIGKRREGYVRSVQKNFKGMKLGFFGP